MVPVGFLLVLVRLVSCWFRFVSGWFLSSLFPVGSIGFRVGSGPVGSLLVLISFYVFSGMGDSDLVPVGF